MTTLKLSDTLFKAIETRLSEMKNPRYYFDQQDEISVSEIVKAMKNENPLYSLQDSIYDSIDTYEIEIDHLADCLEYFKDELEDELGDIDPKELAHDLRDDFLDYLSVDINIDSIMPTVNVRISMYSNYDCINSHWLESQGPYTLEDSYFGDMVKQLRLNPKEVKQMLLDKGMEVAGRWPNKPGIKPLVTLEHFWRELENASCGANLLTFLARIDAKEYLSKPKKIVVPKGNMCGLFSSFQGGGSVLEMELQTDFEIDLTKKYDRSGYLSYGLSIDDPSNSYSIQNVYGTDSSMFGYDLKVLPA